MKQFQVRILSVTLILTLAFSLAPIALAATYDYPVEGGSLKFDPTTGTITDCDNSVYSADIPSEIYGVAVTAIGENAFRNCKKLVSVSIPSTVTSIGHGAFSNCNQLTTISIPDSVTTMDEAGAGTGIFYSCSSLETIEVPGSVKKLPFGMFSQCKNLRTVTLGEGIEEIGRNLFDSCSCLEEIVFPDSLTSIPSHVFYGCKNLKTITVGSGVKYLDTSAFSITTKSKLESIYFRGDAPSTAAHIINKTDYGFKIYYPEGASGWTSPTWNGYITESYVLTEDQTQEEEPKDPSNTQTAPTKLVTATPTSSTVYVNGAAVNFDAYNINNSNYFKLRDLAFILSGSEAQFNVVWDDGAKTISLLSGQSYTPVGGEMTAQAAINKIAQENSSPVLLDGSSMIFTAYTIDGSNYFRLRDIGQAFNFGVTWEESAQCIRISTNEPYVE